MVLESDRIECTVDWRDSLVTLPAGISLARLQNEGFEELEKALNASNAVHQGRTNSDNGVIVSPVYTLANFPPSSPESVASDNETLEEKSSWDRIWISNEDSTSNQAVLCQRLDSVSSDSSESEYRPSTKANASSRKKRVAKILRELEDHNGLGEKEAGFQEVGSESVRRLRPRKPINYHVPELLLDEACSTLTEDDGSKSITQGFKSPPEFTESVSDDASQFFGTISNAPEPDSPARSSPPMSTSDLDLEERKSSRMKTSDPLLSRRKVVLETQGKKMTGTSPKSSLEKVPEKNSSLKTVINDTPPLSKVEAADRGQKRELCISDGDVCEQIVKKRRGPGQ